MIVTYTSVLNNTVIYANILYPHGDLVEYWYYRPTDRLKDCMGKLVTGEEREEIIFAILQHRAADTSYKARVC